MCIRDRPTDDAVFQTMDSIHSDVTRSVTAQEQEFADIVMQLGVVGRLVVNDIKWSRDDVIAHAEREAAAVTKLLETTFDDKLGSTAYATARLIVEGIDIDNAQIERDATLSAQGVNERIEQVMERQLGVSVPVNVRPEDVEFAGAQPGLPGGAAGPGVSLFGRNRQRGPIEVRIVNEPQAPSVVTVPAGDDSKSNYRRLESINRRGTKNYRVSASGRG